jgi:hypothetical protein
MLIEQLVARIDGPQIPVPDSRMPSPSPRPTVEDAPIPLVSCALESMTPRGESPDTASAMAARSDETGVEERAASPLRVTSVEAASPLKPVSLWRQMKATVSATVDRAMMKCQTAVQN